MNTILYTDQLCVKIATSRTEAGICAAEDIASCLRSLQDSQEEINMIFAAAPSQNEMLSALVSLPDIRWDKINAFHMDEYIGLPQDAPQSFGRYLREHLFDKVPFRAVYTIQDETETPEQTIERYSALLRAHPVDVVCLGIGENGHIAFNDPPVADFHDLFPMKKVQLDPVCRTQQVHDGCFASLDDVPQYALTLTIPALCRAAHMFCTVPAATKAQAVYDTIHQPINERVPATILRTHPHAVLYCDPDSASLL